MKIIKPYIIILLSILFFSNLNCRKVILDDEELEVEINDLEDLEDYSNYTVAVALSENAGSHEVEGDYTWEVSSENSIVFNENTVSFSGNGASINGTKITITRSGTYRITGTLSEGQLIINLEDEGIVRLIMDGMSIHCSNSAPFYVINAQKTVIVLNDETSNSLSDGSAYVFEDSSTDEPNATLFSKDDISISGNGNLVVNANYNDGIASKDGLIIHSGNIEVNAADDGIRGKDYLIINGGVFNLDTEGDALKADNDTDPSMGYIYITEGTFNINSRSDAIFGETDVLISDGSFSISTSSGTMNYDKSVKAIKAGSAVVIDKCEASVDSKDDAVHSNQLIVINGGNFEISTSDDGIHADILVCINNGSIDINSCYEGLEGENIMVNNGNIQISSSDDGVNVVSSTETTGGGPGGFGGPQTQEAGDFYLYINGGYLAVYSDGDGLDANGYIVMSDGNVIIHGPTTRDNGALDCNGEFQVNGGLLVAAGSSGMAEAPGSSSSQNTVFYRSNTTRGAGTMLHLEGEDGTGIASFKSSKQYQSVVISSPGIVTGQSYKLYFGGSSSGSETNGLYDPDDYNPGTLYRSFSISNVVTYVN